MNISRQEILNNTVAQLKENFLNEAAPDALLAVTSGMHKTHMLFSSKDAALDALMEMKQDLQVDVELDGHGYVVSLCVRKSLSKEPSNADNIMYTLDIISEASAIAISEVNPHVELLGYVELYGKANDMWFAEPM